MALTLEMATKQSLSLSPLMLQRLELMALPIQDLQAKIQEAVESNPALEIPNNFERSLDNITASLPTKEKGDDYSDSSAYGSDTKRISSLPDSGSYRSTTSSYGEEASNRKQAYMENALTTGETLTDHLMSQLHTDNLSNEEKTIGELIISNLDQHGFHRVNPHTLLTKEGLSEQPEEKELIDTVIKKIQNYDPVGCATDSWRDSVIIQALDKGLKEEEKNVFSQLVFFFLQKIREGKKTQVAKKLDIEVQTIDTYVDLLKTLTPYPGNAYDSSPDSFVLPDLSIHQKNGNLDMHTSAANLPDLKINKEFVAIGNETKDKETKKYIKEQLATAKELITQINMRNGNLYKLGLILIEHQKEFFFKGPLYLKPLTQKDVAAEMDVHETTVSRLANSKWIDCDWGIIPVKNLFSTAVETSCNTESKEMSKIAIQEVIKQILIDNEGKKALSDQKIANKLAEKGIKIARRTVAKYRSELQIDTAYIRNANR